MSEIVISGYYGFGNAGDEAMLAAMIEALTDIEPDLKITVISGNPEDSRARHGVDSVYRLNYPAIIRAISRADLLISGGGSLLQDVTSDRSLYYYLSIIMLAKKLNKPVMLYAQGIGPVRGTLARSAMRCIGNMVDMITVRDIGSRDELASLGVTRPPIHVTADPVLAIHPVDKAIGRSILRRHELEGVAPLVGLSVREWKNWSYYKHVVAQAADRIVEEFGARIVFLPMQSHDDVEVSLKIAARMKQRSVVLTDEYTTSERLSLVGNLDLLIGVRLHALIFGAVMKVPMIGISYDPKIDRFLETFGEHHAGSLTTVTVDGILEKVRSIWPHLHQNDPMRDDRISNLREKAFRNAELALSLIDDRKGTDVK